MVHSTSKKVQCEGTIYCGMTKEEFGKCRLVRKLELLRSDGLYVGARELPSHRVHLFSLGGYFVEMFVLKTLNQVQWIEVQENTAILQEYTEDLDWKDELGL